MSCMSCFDIGMLFLNFTFNDKRDRIRYNNPYLLALNTQNIRQKEKLLQNVSARVRFAERAAMNRADSNTETGSRKNRGGGRKMQNERKPEENGMPVAQALAERSFLVKKIFDATDEARFVGTVRRAEEKSMAKRIENARFEQQAEASYQSIMEDIEQYQRIDRAILESDAATYIETSRGRFTVAEALSLKRRLDGSDLSGEDLDFEENLCRKIRREYEDQMAEVKRNNRHLQHMKERAYLNSLDQEEEWRKNQILTAAETYAEENTARLSDPLNILERARKLTEENDRLLVELNTQIRLSNANTLLQI